MKTVHLGHVTAFIALLLATVPAKAQQAAAVAMVGAITEQCLAKLEEGVSLATTGLVEGGPALRQAFLPGRDGSVWRTGAPEVMIVDPEAAFACHVVGEGVPLSEFSAAFASWIRSGRDGFRLDGRLPLTARNQRGLYLAKRLPDGDYVQISVLNAGEGRLSALLNRVPNSPRARSLLRQ